MASLTSFRSAKRTRASFQSPGYTNRLDCDVVFVVRLNINILKQYRAHKMLMNFPEYTVPKQFCAHKDVLAKNSPVFRDMFVMDENPHTRFNEFGQQVIFIDDVSSFAFEYMMYLIYDVDVPDELKFGIIFCTAWLVAYCAEKYEFEPLKDVVRSFCRDPRHTYFRLLTFALRYPFPGAEVLPRLTDRAFLEGVRDVSVEAVKYALENVRYPTTNAVFNFVIKWSYQRCLESQVSPTIANRRSFLMPLLQFIPGPYLNQKLTEKPHILESLVSEIMNLEPRMTLHEKLQILMCNVRCSSRKRKATERFSPSP